MLYGGFRISGLEREQVVRPGRPDVIFRKWRGVFAVRLLQV